ncbi:unnamed protein product, partial [Acidithrix sp. C25]
VKLPGLSSQPTLTCDHSVKMVLPRDSISRCRSFRKAIFS